MRETGYETSIAVVVLNWNGASDTLACLDSLSRSIVPVTSIVVDNGSTGTDVKQLQASGLADAIIETRTNLGYAEGNNVGLRYALADSRGFFVIGVLNNDTVVQPSAFAVLAQHLERQPLTHRVIAPTIARHEDPTSVWFAGGTFDNGWPRHLQPDELPVNDGPLRPSEWLTGCCIVAHADTWRYVGLFDPRYYLIFEDCEWSLRARRLGVKLEVSTEARIEHRVSRSFASTSSSRLGSYYYARNGLRLEWTYSRRHIGRLLVEQVVRPTLSTGRRMDWRPGLLFRWLGLLGFLVGQAGVAPRYVAQLAQLKSQTKAEDT